MRSIAFACVVAAMLAPVAAFPSGQARADEVPVPRSYGDAMRWYRDASRAGDPKAMFYLALTLEQGLQDRPRPQEAVSWYRRSAEAGFALAQFKLGVLYQTGTIVARDPVEARSWYEKAAAQGMASAQYNLAVLLEIGEGGPVNQARAATLYRDAAASGVSEAFLNLGNLYARGAGVPADIVEALKWLILADDAGVEAAAELRRSVEAVLDDGERSRARAAADAWKSAHPQ